MRKHQGSTDIKLKIRNRIWKEEQIHKDWLRALIERYTKRATNMTVIITVD